MGVVLSKIFITNKQKTLNFLIEFGIHEQKRYLKVIFRAKIQQIFQNSTICYIPSDQTLELSLALVKYAVYSWVFNPVPLGKHCLT